MVKPALKEGGEGAALPGQFIALQAFNALKETFGIRGRKTLKECIVEIWDESKFFRQIYDVGFPISLSGEFGCEAWTFLYLAIEVPS